jgi:hypothetical protein
MIRLIILSISVLFIWLEKGFLQETKILNIEVPKQVSIPRGETLGIKIEVNIKETYHIQANPVNDDFLIPTSLEIKPDKIVIPGTPIYPTGKSFKLEGLADNISVYDGKFSITLPIYVRNTVQPGEYPIKGKLHYQACDSARCFAPRSISFTIPLIVEKY